MIDSSWIELFLLHIICWNEALPFSLGNKGQANRQMRLYLEQMNPDQTRAIGNHCDFKFPNHIL